MAIQIHPWTGFSGNGFMTGPEMRARAQPAHRAARPRAAEATSAVRGSGGDHRGAGGRRSGEQARPDARAELAPGGCKQRVRGLPRVLAGTAISRPRSAR